MRDTEATLRVEGTVTTVNVTPAGTVFINFGLPYPRQTFAAIIFHEDTSRFPDPKQWGASGCWSLGSCTCTKSVRRWFSKTPTS